jgi:hypothetical protein
MAKSSDGGNTWSEPKRVNDDPPGKQQFFTWMTVDQASGNIYFVFYDRRNYDNINTDVYMARSTDGGETFENFKISESPFFPSSGVFFGDYTNITAYNDQVRPIWARGDGGYMSIWTAIVDLTVGIQEQEETIPFTLAQNYPNPFRETTYFSFKLKETETISLIIYDIYGRQITALIDREQRIPGKYVETFVPNKYKLTPGVYWFVLTNGKSIQKRKMLLVE